jgi:hypothetical protein
LYNDQFDASTATEIGLDDKALITLSHPGTSTNPATLYDPPLGAAQA